MLETRNVFKVPQDFHKTATTAQTWVTTPAVMALTVVSQPNVQLTIGSAIMVKTHNEISKAWMGSIEREKVLNLI